MDTHTHTPAHKQRYEHARACTSVSTSLLLMNISQVLSDVIHLIPESSVCFLFSFLLHVHTLDKFHHFSLFYELNLCTSCTHNHPVKMLSPCGPGHLLGLSHDDSKFCEERFGVNSDKRLMSSILTSIDASKPWSRCTSATITDFFDDGNGECGRRLGERKSPCWCSFNSENFSLPVGVLFSPSINCIHVTLTCDSFSSTPPFSKSCLLPNRAVISVNRELFTILLTS